MDPVVVEMHTSAACYRHRRVHGELKGGGRRRSRSSASTYRRRMPLCGNSIGTDRRLAIHLPEIEHLHYDRSRPPSRTRGGVPGGRSTGQDHRPPSLDDP
jgi:hypothetical protein